MASPINLLERYILDQYDKTSQTGIGLIGAVDPHEKGEFLSKDVGVDPASFLKLLESDPKDVRASFIKSTFEGWKFKVIAKAPYLSDLQLEQFKAELLGTDSAPASKDPLNVVIMNIGDEKASGQFNSSATVAAARIRDIPREGRAFVPQDPSSEVTFTIELDSVNAYNRLKNDGGNSSMLSLSRVYILPKGYNGKVPLLPEEMTRWYEKAKASGMTRPMEEYFFEIDPGTTEARSFKIFNNGRGDFSYTIKMPPGSYEVHGVAGEFKQGDNDSDFDNFIIRVSGQNAIAQTEKLFVPIATRIEVEDPLQRRFIEEIMKTAEEQGDNSLKGKKVDIIFAIDNSFSMQPGADLVRQTVADIVGALKRGGAVSVRVGVITFNNPNSIFTIMPLTEMNSSRLVTLYNVIAAIRFTGGLEPVGKAALKAISQLKEEKGRACQVMVITDSDGLSDDSGVIYSDEVAMSAIAANIAVNLQQINPDLKSSWPIAQIMTGEYTDLLNKLPDPNDEKKIEKIRKLAFGGKTGGMLQLKARQVLISVGSKEDLDLISETLNEIIDTPMLKILVGRGAVARDALYKVAKGAVDADHSREAAEGLILIDGSEAVKELENILQDKNISFYNRREIAYVLALNGNEPAARFIADSTIEDPTNVDSNTLKLLISKGAAFKDALVSVAMSRADLSSRIEAVKALAIIDKESAIKGAKKIFYSAPTSSEAVELILISDNENGAAFLKGILQDDELPYKDRIVISKSLAARGDEAAIDYLCAEVSVKQDPEELLKLLATIGGKGLDTVRKLAMNAYACNTRLAAAEALMAADKETAKAAIKEMVDNPEGREYFNRPAIRFKALSLLLALDEKEALKILRKYLQNGNDHERLHAAELLLPYDQKAAKKVLAGLARKPEFASKVRLILSKLPK